MQGIQIDFVEYQADEDRVKLTFLLLCDKVIPRHITKTLTLEQLREATERLTAIHDYAVESQAFQRAGTPVAPEPLPLIVEKVAGKYHQGSGV